MKNLFSITTILAIFFLSACEKQIDEIQSPVTGFSKEQVKSNEQLSLQNATSCSFFNDVNLIRISKSQMTTLTGASRASGFKHLLKYTGTGFGYTDHTWEFEIADWDNDACPDLIGIKKSNTGSKRTEIHIASGASGFQQFIVQTATGFGYTNYNWAFEIADWDGDTALDLIGIKKSDTGRKTEVHIASGASGFQQFILQTGTAFDGSSIGYNAVYEVADWDYDKRPDLIGIDRGGLTVLVASGASGFQRFISSTSHTVFFKTDSQSDVQRDSQIWEFEIADWDGDTALDLIGIKKKNTGTRTTEVHVASGAGGFQQFILQTGTSFPETDHTSEFVALDVPVFDPIMK